MVASGSEEQRPFSWQRHFRRELLVDGRELAVPTVDLPCTLMRRDIEAVAHEPLPGVRHSIVVRAAADKLDGRKLSARLLQERKVHGRPAGKVKPLCRHRETLARPSTHASRGGPSAWQPSLGWRRDTVAEPPLVSCCVWRSGQVPGRKTRVQSENYAMDVAARR